jgi:FtsK/SpoIIIE family
MMKESPIRHLSRQLVRQLRWRIALQRCGIDPGSLRLVSSLDRFDGNAATYTLESRTRAALQFLDRGGPELIGWAMGKRVLDLGGDPYHPNLHHILIEDEPLDVGALPTRTALTWTGQEISVPIGRDETSGDSFELPLFTPGRGTSSLLIAGTTGGGKSNSLRVVLEGLWGQADVVGIDAKSGETFRELSGRLLKPYVDPIAAPDEAAQLLTWLIGEMEERHRNPNPMHRPIFLVIEEWAALPDRADLLDSLDRIAAQGRSAHCGIIAVTQRPTATKVIRTTTRANLPIRIAHSTVGDEAASEAILGGGFREAANLPTVPAGMALIRQGGGSLDGVRIYRARKYSEK